MRKQTLNEEISRIKGMMGKIMNESFDDFDTQIQPEELPYSDDVDMGDEEEEFKVGDTVSDPEELNASPEHDGKILNIFPNLESAKGQPGYDSIVDWIQRFPQYAEGHDTNGKWYHIEWRTEGIGLYSEKDMERIIIAPDGRDYDDYEDEDEEDYDDGTCGTCGGSGGGEGYYRCPVCRGSGSSGRSRYRDDY
jgi:hypothetical protein